MLFMSEPREPPRLCPQKGVRLSLTTAAIHSPYLIGTATVSERHPRINLQFSLLGRVDGL